MSGDESGPGTARSRHTGRRPGNADTRTAILDAARARFAGAGFDKTSIRAVAADAEVDPALVHHYFGTKQQLFAAAVEFPVDPELFLRAIDAAPLDQLGVALVRGAVTVWDSPAGPGVVATVRRMLAGEPNLVRSFLLQVVLERVRTRIATDEDDGRWRVSLVATQMMGILIARKVLELEPLASMPLSAVVAAVGPTVQRYLTGDIDQSVD